MMCCVFAWLRHWFRIGRNINQITIDKWLIVVIVARLKLWCQFLKLVCVLKKVPVRLEIFSCRISQSLLIWRCMGVLSNQSSETDVRLHAELFIIIVKLYSSKWRHIFRTRKIILLSAWQWTTRRFHFLLTFHRWKCLAWWWSFESEGGFHRWIEIVVPHRSIRIAVLV